jgi:hypothetical protein
MGNELFKLKTFIISYNKFHGVLPASVCNASMLQYIEIISTFLSGRVPECLGAHQMNLSVVALVESEFEATNDADWSFMSSLSNCSNMRQLGLESNKLKDVLPNSIANFSIGMEFLSIEDNKITGTIPGGIGNLVNLEILVMGQNILLGAIPSSLSKLKKLNLLSLSNNILSGPILETLGNLTQLTKLFLSGFFISTLSIYMNLSHNSLLGALPSEVGNLKNLNEIDFSNNMISSEVPDSISDCQSLVYLSLSRNTIQGKIPVSLGTIRGLFRLDLSYNNLSGTILETLATLTGISSLNLMFNKLQGRVPTNGVFQNATVVFITGNDGLCGGIPQLKLPPCSNHSTKKSHKKIAMILSICSGCIFVTLVFVVSSLHQKSQETKVNNM